MFPPLAGDRAGWAFPGSGRSLSEGEEAAWRSDLTRVCYSRWINLMELKLLSVPVLNKYPPLRKTAMIFSGGL